MSQTESRELEKIYTEETGKNSRSRSRGFTTAFKKWKKTYSPPEVENMIRDEVSLTEENIEELEEIEEDTVIEEIKDVDDTNKLQTLKDAKDAYENFGVVISNLKQEQDTLPTDWVISNNDTVNLERLNRLFDVMLVKMGHISKRFETLIRKQERKLN